MVLTALLMGCSAVQLETGDVERSAESSQRKAETLKADFARQIRSATDNDLVALYLNHSSFVVDRYVDFSRDMAQQMTDAQRATGQAYTASRILAAVKNAVEPEVPILRAWDENHDLALEEIKYRNAFAQDLIGATEEVATEYYKVQAAATEPRSGLDSYEADVEDAASRFDRAVESAVKRLELYR